MALDCPMMGEAPLLAPVISACRERSRSISDRESASRAAAVRVASIFSFCHGLSTKSVAPRWWATSWTLCGPYTSAPTPGATPSSPNLLI